MTRPVIPGMVLHGAHYRFRIDLPEAEAAAVATEAADRALSNPDIIRGIVRQWRMEKEARPSSDAVGGSATTRRGSSGVRRVTGS